MALGKNVSPRVRDNKGISLIFINSSVGKSTFDHASELLEIIPSNTKECMQDCFKKMYTAKCKTSKLSR